MTRTVVPPSSSRRRRGQGAEPGDGLPEKLVKYVPAETLAFFVPTAAALGTDHDGALIAAILIGAAGTVGYLWLAARGEPPAKRPLPHFYALSVIAFACWALGTGPSVMQLVGVDPTVAGVILGFGVFVIPLVDGILSELLG